MPASIVKAPVAMFANLGEAGAASEGGSRASAMLRPARSAAGRARLRSEPAAWNTAQRRPYARGRLDLEALGPVVRGELPLAVNANRASDLLAAHAAWPTSSNLKLILMGAAEGWRVADELPPQSAGRRQAADRHPDLRRAWRDARESGAAVQGRRGARAVVVRHAQRA